MNRARWGGPAAYEARLRRAEALLTDAHAAAEPLRLLVDVLRHQTACATDPEVMAAADAARCGAGDRLAARSFPLLDLDAITAAAAAEVLVAVASLTAPPPLAAAGHDLAAMAAGEREDLAALWLDDATLVDPLLGFWLRVAAGPILELAARDLTLPAPTDWQGSACPVCGGQAQVSVIAEGAGDFLAGAPRSLVCARCATWWSFPRLTCALCGEEDPRLITPFVAEGRPWVRIDACETCHGYVKTIDLRDMAASGAAPLVDDVATLALDIWAGERGLERPMRSLAGV